MTTVDVLLGVVGLATGGFWVFCIVQVFQSDRTDARICGITAFFGALAFICLAALVCRHFLRRLSRIEEHLAELKQKD